VGNPKFWASSRSDETGPLRREDFSLRRLQLA